MTAETSNLNVLNNTVRPQRLLRQFGVLALITIVGGMLATGAWLTNEIHSGIIEHTTLSTAVFMERFIQPHIQELKTRLTLSPSTIENLDILSSQGLIHKHVVSMKIWRPDGTIAFSNEHSLIGQRFEIEGGLKSALTGQFATEYAELDSNESKFEQTLSKKLIEIYVPMVNVESGKIYAVSEFYIDGNALPADLRWRYFKSWIVVALFTIAMLLPLYFIVRRGDKTIVAQETAIRNRMIEMSELLSENRRLNGRLVDANRASTSLNERFLNRIGADLHDGPVQMLAAALLWFDGLSQKKERSLRQQQRNWQSIELIRSTIKDVLKEVRSIATGLVLPELTNRSLAETLGMIVEYTRKRTKTAVDLEYSELPEISSSTLNDTVYRFIQEGLNNSYHHAGGRGQKVKASVDKRFLVLVVSDTGDGFDESVVQNVASHLGLSGMRNRITAIGGEFQISTTLNEGTTLTARIPLARFTKNRTKDKSLAVA
jgi:signal transduction histidine kinase